MRVRIASGWMLAVALLLACGGGGGSSPLDLPRLEWTWVDVPGAICADGSPTGLAVNPGPEGATDVLVFLNGGGACWDAASCDPHSPTRPPGGPYGQAEFTADEPRLPGSILDRTVTGSPFGGATLVFVPYCTGDVHWGQSSTDLSDGSTWRFAGAENLRRDIAWLRANLPAPEKLVVSGSSAGGFGSLLAHDLARTAWPGAKGYLVDDSGPPLVGDDILLPLRLLWWTGWRLDRTVTPRCPGCRDDVSQMLNALAAKYPNDRIALLSTRQDQVIRSFVLLTPENFENALLQLVDERIAPLAPNVRAFLVPGDDHPLLDDFAGNSADGTPLADWIRQMVQDENVWSTLGREPPPAP